MEAAMSKAIRWISSIAALALFAGVVTLFSPTATGADEPELVVAIRPVQLQTNTKLFSYPVEAQRGEVWQVVRRTKKKLILTFGPDDPRGKRWSQMGSQKLPTYGIDAAEFSAAFVSEDAWPAARKKLARELRGSLPDMQLADLERLIEGKVWPGMTQKAAEVAVGTRVLRKEKKQTKDGVTERWQVGAFSLGIVARSTAEEYVDESVWLGRPQDTLDERGDRRLDRSVRMILVFKDGVLTEVTER